MNERRTEENTLCTWTLKSCYHEVFCDLTDSIAKACQILGRDWDPKSVLAMIENCSFTRIDQEASADA